MGGKAATRCSSEPSRSTVFQVQVLDGLKAAAPDQITDGVFIVDGVYVDGVGNRDPVVPCGVNGMAFNDRSAVDRQIVEEKMSFYGPGGSGFGNVGIANGPRSDALHPRIPVAVIQRARRGADHG